MVDGDLDHTELETLDLRENGAQPRRQFVDVRGTERIGIRHNAVTLEQISTKSTEYYMYSCESVFCSCK